MAQLTDSDEEPQSKGSNKMFQMAIIKGMSIDSKKKGELLAAAKSEKGLKLRDMIGGKMKKHFASKLSL